MIDERGFIVRKIRITTLNPMRCAVCLKNDYSGMGKLWDNGAGQYEYICPDCEKQLLEDAKQGEGEE